MQRGRGRTTPGGRRCRAFAWVALTLVGVLVLMGRPAYVHDGAPHYFERSPGTTSAYQRTATVMASPPALTTGAYAGLGAGPVSMRALTGDSSAHSYDLAVNIAPSRLSWAARATAPEPAESTRSTSLDGTSPSPLASALAAETEPGLANDAAQGCSANSFTAATPVLLANGTEIPISRVAVGDTVLATDPQTGQTAPRPVTKTIVHTGEHTMVDVTLADGSKLTATDHHPFWDVTTGKFTFAIDLRPSDRVEGPKGELLAVTTVKAFDEFVTAYNLTVGGIHTYYAGTTPVLVHNSCADLDRLSQSGETRDRNGFTQAGRAFQKHFFRPGSTFASPTAAGFLGDTQAPAVLNPLGQSALDDILTDPRTAIQSYGNTADYRLPWGGARFVNDVFTGFLSP